MKKSTKYIVSILFVICLVSTATIQVIGKPIESSEQINSKEMLSKSRQIRRWLVFGIGKLGFETPHGRYFKPALQFPMPRGGYSLTFYIDLDNTKETGCIYNGVIWKNANPTGEFNCNFIGHMGLATILGIYIVDFN